MTQHKICQIPVFRFCTDTNTDADKFFSSKAADNILDPVMSACTAFFADTKLPRLQIDIIVDHDQLCLRIDLEIAGHLLDRTAA